MANLDTYLAGLAAPQLQWIQGRVASISGGYLSLTYGDGVIPNVAYLEQYTPVVGDYVHALSLDPVGVLVLGTTAPPSPIPAAPIPQTPQIFNASGFATFNQVLSTWTPNVLVQDEDEAACFFYTPSVFAGISSTPLQQVEIEITRTSGGPPAFITHLNLNTLTALQLPSDLVFWRPDITMPAGVPTWVTLPLGWGQDLVTGNIKGFGIWTALDVPGVYSGTGRVRLTPLSVTI